MAVFLSGWVSGFVEDATLLCGLCAEGCARGNFFRIFVPFSENVVMKSKINFANPIWGHVLLFVAAAFFGGNAPMVKDLSEHGVSAVAVADFRSVGAAVAFWVASFFVKRGRERVSLHTLGKLFIASMLGIVLNQGLFTVGISYTSPVNATIMATMLPIIAMLFSALIIKERITLPKVVGLVIGLAGALLLVLGSGRGEGGGLKGDVMCLVAQTCVGFYMVAFSKIVRRYSVFTLMKWMFLYSAIVLTVVTWPQLSAIDYASLPPMAWTEIVFIVFCGTFLSYVCFTFGQQVLSPTIVGMYNYVQPIVATILAVAIGVGRFGWREMIAMVLVFGGVYIVNRAKNFERAKQNQ